MDPRRLTIIDGYSLLYRAFFATRYLSTSDGRPTNALFGFVGMLFTLLEQKRPHAIVVAMDAPGKTFRHHDYAEYKGTRKETVDELKVQLVGARELIQSLGIPVVEVTGFEADDVVGTISRLAEENGYHTLIVTGDLDALQLVDECVRVLTPGKGMSETTEYGIADVEARYGFGPEFVPDFKALKGDTSDNIPGVPGIGDKGAAELIGEFGTIEAMLENFEKLPAKYQKKIAGNEDQMRKSKWLATIVREAPVQYDFKPFVLTEAELKAAVAMLESFEFRAAVRKAPTLLGRYLDGASPASQAEEDATPTVEVLDEALQVDASDARNYADLVKFVADGPFAAYLAAAPRKDLFEEGDAPGYIAVGQKVLRASGSDVRKLAQDLADRAIFHDAKPFYQGTKDTPTPYFDTRLAAYVLRSERASYLLRELTQAYLEVTPPETPEQLVSGLYLLEAPLRDRLVKEGQLNVLTEIELPLVPILAEMEDYGIRADKDQLRGFSEELSVAIEEITARIYELAGRDFTIGSPKQLGEILFDELKLPGATKTKTGYATGVEILGELAAEHEIAAKVLEWRELSKLKSTYADSLGKLVREDGRIHTTYNQAVAATGRLSSENPNLQNIPIRTELGRGIRKAFQAEEGYKLASLDYSQIELRVLAHMCGEQSLVEAFNEHEDVHTVTASQMFELEEG
ncbi:DNA polymerase I, partial [bacterium]